jgi:Na+-transporting methylmalonyl-CoA/oxaloacetate decarboxylase gamma subunit
MKANKVIVIGMLLILFLAMVPSSQARHAEQAAVETEPTLNSDLYMGFGILIILLIILFIGFMSYRKESQVPPPKAPVKRKKKAVKKAIVEEESVEGKPVKQKAVKKKAIKGSKTYTSNNVEIVELTRRTKGKRTKKRKFTKQKYRYSGVYNDAEGAFGHHRLKEKRYYPTGGAHMMDPDRPTGDPRWLFASKAVSQNTEYSGYRRKPKKAKIVWFRNKKKR